MAVLRGANTILLNSGSQVIVHPSFSQNISASGDVIVFDSVERNIKSAWDTSSNKFVCKTDGFYEIKANIHIQTPGPVTSVNFRIEKNGGITANSDVLDIDTDYRMIPLSIDTELVEGDEIQLKIFGTGISGSTILGGGVATYLFISLYPS